MDSYDNDLMLLLFLDDDLFFVEADGEEEEDNDVGILQPEPGRGS
jgi:hypothetical protein